MTDATALLRAITTHPDEDTPRLAYADYLDEHGAAPPRTTDRAERFARARRGAFEAEFIRVQCRLAQFPFDDPDYPELLERHSDLAYLLHADDRNRLPDVPEGIRYDPYGEGHPSRGSEYRRGFLESVIYWDSWNHDAAAVRAFAPKLEELVATSPARTLRVSFGHHLAGLAEFLKLPVLEAFRGLILDRDSGDARERGEADEVVQMIASCPRLANLRRLAVGTPFGEPGLLALAKSPHLGNVNRLSLKSGGFTATGLAALDAGWAANLRELDIDGHARGADPMPADAFAALGRLNLPHLRSLEVYWAEGDRASVSAFARGKFPRLGELSLRYIGTRTAAIRALTLARGWPLRNLHLEPPRLGPEGIKELAAWPLANGLRVLSVSNGDISGAGAKVLAGSPRFAGLRHLDLNSNPLGGSGLMALARSKHLRGLRSLGLLHTRGRSRMTVTDGAAFLAALDMPELRHLYLWGPPVGTRGAQTIARSERFANLTQLSLEGCAVGDAGAAAILAAPHLQRLVRLNLCANPIDRGVEALTRPGVLPWLTKCQLYSTNVNAKLSKRLRARGVEM